MGFIEIVVSNQNTINKIDDIWVDLNIGEFIASPSLVHENYARINSAYKSKME